MIVETCNAIGRRVDAVINQDGCRIADDLYDRYADMVAYVKKHHYDRSARYATSAITRQKLQDALKRRGLDTIIFERPRCPQLLESSSGKLRNSSVHRARARRRDVVDMVRYLMALPSIPI